MIAMPLIAVVWMIAYLISFAARVFVVPFAVHSDFVAMSIGGVVGGLGLVLVNAVGRRRLLSLRHLIEGGVIGCIAALPFGLWLLDLHHSGGDRTYLQCSFAIWQAAVGTYLYIVCTQVEKVPSEAPH
jgi:hypothetical protein